MANMEDVLEVYQRPYDPTIPQICMDEQPVQLIKETLNHLVGQAVLDRIDERHEAILPEHVWNDGDPDGVTEVNDLRPPEFALDRSPRKKPSNAALITD